MSNSIEIQGFTALQKDLADRIWSMDTQHEVESFIYGLPRSLRTQAWIVLNMIIAAELDTVMEVTDELKDYLCSR